MTPEHLQYYLSKHKCWSRMQLNCYCDRCTALGGDERRGRWRWEESVRGEKKEVCKKYLFSKFCFEIINTFWRSQPIFTANNWSIIIIVTFLIGEAFATTMTNSPSDKMKHHSVWHDMTWNTCTSVFPNTRIWRQQEQNSKTDEEGKKKRVNIEISTAGTKKISPDGLIIARAYRPPGRSSQKLCMNYLTHPNLHLYNPSTTDWGPISIGIHQICRGHFSLVWSSHFAHASLDGWEQQ